MNTIVTNFGDISDCLKNGHKVSINGLKAKILKKDNEGVILKFETTGVVKKIADEDLYNLDIKILDKLHPTTQQILDFVKSEATKNSN